MVSTALPDLDQLDIEALKVLIVERHDVHVEALSSQAQQIEHLKLVIEKLRRMMFGSKSEKVTIQVEQFELQLEETETEQAAAEENTAASVSEDKPRSKSRPSRKPLPAHLPREVIRHEPGQDCCPDCNGALRLAPFRRRRSRDSGVHSRQLQGHSSCAAEVRLQAVRAHCGSACAIAHH